MKLKKVLLYIVPPVAIIGIIYIINRQSIKKKISEGVKNSPLPETNIAATSQPSTTNVFPLKKGSKNNKVAELQRILGIEDDGTFGSQTESALKSFSGKTTVDSQSELSTLAAKKSNQQNASQSISRAQELLKQFQSGGLNIYTQVDTICYGYTQDYAGAINYNSKNITLKRATKFGNSDYKLIGYTKAGNLQMQVTRGELAGTYVVNPNSITLVK